MWGGGCRRVVCGATHGCRWRVEGTGVAESSFVEDASTMRSKANGRRVGVWGDCRSAGGTGGCDAAAVRINK